MSKVKINIIQISSFLSNLGWKFVPTKVENLKILKKVCFRFISKASTTSPFLQNCFNLKLLWNTQRNKMLFQRIFFFLFKQLGHSWNVRESRGGNTIQNQANVWLRAIGQIIKIQIIYYKSLSHIRFMVSISLFPKMIKT